VFDSLTGIGNHWGGSCQVGFSVDAGKTFQVATSYHGNCPHRDGGESADGQTFDFTVPADIPTGDVVFAWQVFRPTHTHTHTTPNHPTPLIHTIPPHPTPPCTEQTARQTLTEPLHHHRTWYNREQEFNMNCAAITITGPSFSSSSSGTTPPAAPAAPAKVAAPAPAPAPSASSYTDPNGCTCTCPAVNFKPAPAPRALHAHGRAHGVPNLVPRANDAAAVKVPYQQRPGFLIADTGNGCETPHTTAEVKFPNPGPDVVVGDGAYPLVLPGPGGMCGY